MFILTLSIGVTQGSVLESLNYLFPLGSIVYQHDLHINYFADDVQLYIFTNP